MLWPSWLQFLLCHLPSCCWGTCFVCGMMEGCQPLTLMGCARWPQGELVVCACSCCWGRTPRVRRGSGTLDLLPVFTESLAAQRWRVCEAESACRSCCVACVWVEGHQVLTCTAATRNPSLPILGNLKDFLALFQWREVMLQKPRVWLWCTLWLHNFLQNTYFHWLWSLRASVTQSIFEH